MNKLVLSLCFFGSLLFSSCSKGDVCDCVEIGLSMMKEEKAAGKDLQKLTEIHEEYRADLEKCEKLDEGRSEKEKKSIEAEMKNCDAFKEMEALSNEMLGQ
jgi:hypothetical protein